MARQRKAKMAENTIYSVTKIKTRRSCIIIRYLTFCENETRLLNKNYNALPIINAQNTLYKCKSRFAKSSYKQA